MEHNEETGGVQVSKAVIINKQFQIDSLMISMRSSLFKNITKLITKDDVKRYFVKVREVEEARLQAEDMKKEYINKLNRKLTILSKKGKGGKNIVDLFKSIFNKPVSGNNVIPNVNSSSTDGPTNLVNILKNKQQVNNDKESSYSSGFSDS